jgi:hypothetical protein
MGGENEKGVRPCRVSMSLSDMGGAEGSLDTADVKEIRELASLGLVDGITTPTWW